jgi:hypothetical protein
MSEHHGVWGALRRVVLGRRQGVSSVVYGTIVVMATVAAGSRGADTDVPNLAGVVAITALVLWIAHVYSHTLADSLERGRRLDVAEFAAVARRELAIPYAAVAPVATLVLAAVGVLESQTAVWIALGFGVATLAVQGARYAALEHLGPGGTLVSVALNVSLGLVIVGLEASIAH